MAQDGANHDQKVLQSFNLIIATHSLPISVDSYDASEIIESEVGVVNKLQLIYTTSYYNY